MTIRPKLIDELLKECADPRRALAEGGLIKQLTKAIIERCLEMELDVHLHNWKPALNCLAIEFSGRFPQ